MVDYDQLMCAYVGETLDAASVERMHAFAAQTGQSIVDVMAVLPWSTIMQQQILGK